MLRTFRAAAMALVALSAVAIVVPADAATDVSAKKRRWVSLNEVTINVEMKKESARPRRSYTKSLRRERELRRVRAAKARAANIRKVKAAKAAQAKAAKAKLAAVPVPVVQPKVPEFGHIMAISLSTLTPMTDEFIEHLARMALEIERVRELAEARAYIVRTATPGGTMTRDGVANNVRKFHPELVLRLMPAIKEARANGLPHAGVHSGYRAPGWGVGGFKDKFNSLHGVGMAVDMHGIGKRGSAASVKWFAIAGRHGIFNPYGPYHRAEHNHYQITMTKAVTRGMPLRATISAMGPIDLERMWKVATSIIRYQPYLGPPPAPRVRYAKRHRSHYAKVHKPRHYHARRHRVRYAGA